MAHFTLIARINAGDGKFPYANVQFSKNHRPIPIEGARRLGAALGGRKKAAVALFAFTVCFAHGIPGARDNPIGCTKFQNHINFPI